MERKNKKFVAGAAAAAITTVMLAPGVASASPLAAFGSDAVSLFAAPTTMSNFTTLQDTEETIDGNPDTVDEVTPETAANTAQQQQDQQQQQQPNTSAVNDDDDDLTPGDDDLPPADGDDDDLPPGDDDLPPADGDDDDLPPGDDDDDTDAGQPGTGGGGTPPTTDENQPGSSVAETSAPEAAYAPPAADEAPAAPEATPQAAPAAPQETLPVTGNSGGIMAAMLAAFTALAGGAGFAARRVNGN